MQAEYVFTLDDAVEVLLIKLSIIQKLMRIDLKSELVIN